MDFIDILLTLLKINKSEIYKDFVIQSATSQLIRGKNHSKRNLKEFFKKIIKYFSLFLRILIFHFRFPFLQRNLKERGKLYELLIVFPDNDEWILRGLSKDFEKEIKKDIINVRACAFSDFSKYRTTHILFIHHELGIKAIKNNSLLVNYSSIYLSHIRTLTYREVEIINKFQYIFCQSSKDKMRLNSLGTLPGRVIHLPVGFDEKIFFYLKDYDKRSFDFVISTPLKTNSSGSHYWLRKSSVLLHETITILASKNFKIMLLGKGWEESLLYKSPNIEIKDATYKEKHNLLNDCKIFLNLSLLEGGPVTILEALACGCNIISKDNGNAFDISQDIPNKIFLLKNSVSPKKVSQKIIQYYETLNNESNKNYTKILKEKYSFSSLGKIITKNIFR